MLDQLVCARASTLVLTAFSAASATLLSRRVQALELPPATIKATAEGEAGAGAQGKGQARTEQAWGQLGARLFFMRRQNPFSDSELLL